MARFKVQITFEQEVEATSMGDALRRAKEDVRKGSGFVTAAEAKKIPEAEWRK